MLLKVSHLYATILLNMEGTLTGILLILLLNFSLISFCIYISHNILLLFYLFVRVYVMGQSAGAHIAACALLEQAIKEASGEKTSWSVSQIKAYFGLSGG